MYSIYYCVYVYKVRLQLTRLKELCNRSNLTWHQPNHLEVRLYDFKQKTKPCFVVVIILICDISFRFNEKHDDF